MATIELVKEAIKRTILYDWYKARKQQNEYRVWMSSGRLVPPPHFHKRAIVLGYAARFGLTNFVEMGTYQGDMVAVTQHAFTKVYSVELSDTLFLKAATKFSEYGHVRIIPGDSAVRLQEILRELVGPALFWLDGHYSGGITAKGLRETPVLQEVDCILSSVNGNHVILIDDARCFTGEHDYPTLESMREFVLARKPESAFEVVDDIIRIHGQRAICVD